MQKGEHPSVQRYEHYAKKPSCQADNIVYSDSDRQQAVQAIFTESDNLPSLSFNKQEIQQTADGNLWMANSKGLIYMTVHEHYRHLSMIALAEMCGFKKTTFFNAFKKFEGCTPGEWADKHENTPAAHSTQHSGSKPPEP